MDFTLVERIEIYGMRYKLLRSNFCRGYYVIIIQSKNEFSCESFSSTKDGALDLFYEIAASATAPYTLHDILVDYQKKEVYVK